MFRTTMLLILLGAFSWNAQASSISYIMDQSNALAEPVPYLEVTIDDDGTLGDINFTVTLLSALTGIADTNFGIQSFGFNLAAGATAPVAANISSAPIGWSFSTNSNQDGFGNFDVVLDGTGGSRQDPTLTFSITGIAGDSLATYYALADPAGDQGPSYFGAHVAGFTDQNPNGAALTSAYFGGGTPSAVPVPAAVWLFGTALIGFVGLSRKTKV